MLSDGPGLTNHRISAQQKARAVGGHAKGALLSNNQIHERIKIKYPNASILTLITQTDGINEKLLFIYLKTIPDFYPSNRIHWYDGAGKDGKPNNVWNKLSIKQ